MKLFDDNWNEHRLGIFEPMPFQGNENMLVDATERAVKEEGEGDDEGDDLNKIDKKKETTYATKAQKKAVAVEENPFDDIFGGGGDSAPVEAPSDVYDPLGDIFGGSGAPVAAASAQPVSSSPFDDIFGGGSIAPSTSSGGMDDIFGGSSGGAGGIFYEEQKQTSPAYTAYEDSNIIVHFKFERDPSDRSNHKITAVYSNKTGSILDGINMQVSVKKYLKLQLFSVSSPQLAPGAKQGATQEMRITNTQEGQSPIVLRTRITYGNAGTGAKVVETKVLDNLPTNY